MAPVALQMPAKTASTLRPCPLARNPYAKRMAKALFEINPALDREALAQEFAEGGLVQIRNVLTDKTAQEIRNILARGTPWGMAMQAGVNEDPQQILAGEMRTDAGRARLQAMGVATDKAASKGEYAFRYAQYSLVQAMNEGWDPGGVHELLLEYLNADDFLGLVRSVTGIDELTKADGQTTAFGPSHFLGRHIDSHVEEGWRIAYVLNFTIDDWQPDWGGYLVFYDEDGDITCGIRPRFNSLNMFAVPRPHAVTYVPPFAPLGRFAITGWLRDR